MVDKRKFDNAPKSITKSSKQHFLSAPRCHHHTPLLTGILPRTRLPGILRNPHGSAKPNAEEFLKKGYAFFFDKGEVRTLEHLIDLIRQAFDIFLHLDAHLDVWLIQYGTTLYAILFTVIFCETGLVVTPFLPGDSLLFAVGALAARPSSPLELGWCLGLLFIAGVLGDTVNYSIGYRVGPKVFTKEKSWLLNKNHLNKTQAFFEKYGGKTIVLARFVPIIRTFAPFVAGIGKMRYRRFIAYNLTGAAAWVSLFIIGGYIFGNLPMVKRNFQYVVMAIIFISILPGIIAYIKERSAAKQGKAASPISKSSKPPIAASGHAAHKSSKKKKK
jgi:membrane-associated protein